VKKINDGKCKLIFLLCIIFFVEFLNYFDQVQMSSQSKESTGTCGVCCENFTEKRRKRICCAACDYEACNVCYKTFMTSEGVSRPKCMQCNTEWTGQFLKQNFSDAFIKGDLRKHTSTILLQQQIAMLPATQPAVERQIVYEDLANEVKDINRQIRELVQRKNTINTELHRIRRNQNANGNGDGDDNNAALDGSGRSLFQHKCCDPECRGFVSSAWKCGTCAKFSCAHCHEVKGATSTEVGQHVCNSDNVETVRLLRTDTKPCPSCGVYIQKTEGCDQMFCISCKQLWSWKTGRIEERGHNPHYLEWMRQRGSVGGGGGGGMARDPLDIECGREVNWQITTIIERECRILTAVCTRSVMSWTNSLIHVRNHEIPAMQRAMEVQGDLQVLRVQYMRKKITDDHFRKRIFQIQRDANVNRQILDLLIAVQNAGTDIVFRILDTFQNQKNTSLIQLYIQSNVNEFAELKKWANQSIADIYSENSKTIQKRFNRAESFALTRP
jgi:hypothetical protein